MNKVSLAPGCPPDCFNCQLRDTPAFADASPKVLESIQAARSHTASLGAGSTLIHEGQRNAQLFTLYSGWAFRYKTMRDGRRQILNFLLPGDLVGLQLEFGGGSDHGVELLTDCSLCVFKNSTLWSLYSEQPRLGYDITWIAAHQEGHVDDNLLTTGQRTALERVAMLFVQLYRRMERLDQVDNGSMLFPPKQQHIADALGLSLVHTNKTMRRLGQLGLYAIKAGYLFIPDVDALAQLAQYHDREPTDLPLL